MGQVQGRSEMAAATHRVEERTGKIAVSGRYHRVPKLIEHDYEIQQTVLGSGYNGVVRMATKKDCAGKFAVKAFKLTNVPKAKHEELQAEVEIFLSMDHPHVARLVDVYETTDNLNLVMECMEGGELFDRITKAKRFGEKDAADSIWQMLLALNYIHSHGIVHRDIKLENFLYDSKTSNHLKLIDFGFSKIWDVNTKMHVSCGTLSYVALEVLQKSYTSQCDMWSLGVIVFILLVGYMPFSGQEHVQTKLISEGKYKLKPECWATVSEKAKDLMKKLLTVDPLKRLTAQQALDHAFITDREKRNTIMDDKEASGVVDALRNFGQASKFRRACMSMMAWSLSNDERAKVRQYFIEMDKTQQGTITLAELRSIMVEKFHISDEETKAIFEALDSNHDDEIHYSDFLAAMSSSRIQLHDDLIKNAFHRFDVDNTGFISPANLKEVLGETCDPAEIDSMIAEADFKQDGQISYAEFVAYLRGDACTENHTVQANKLIDNELKKVHSEDVHGTHSASSIPNYLKGRAQLVLQASVSAGQVLTGGKTDRNSGSNMETKKKQPGCCAVQ